MLAVDVAAVPLQLEAMDATKNGPEPVHLRDTSRCASRGPSRSFGTTTDDEAKLTAERRGKSDGGKRLADRQPDLHNQL